MILAIILTTLAAVPDLCADVYTDADGTAYEDALGQTFPRHCQWSGADVPRLDAELCCVTDGDDATCDFPDLSGRCIDGERFYCEHGEATGDGAACYQPFVDACELGFCVEFGTAQATMPLSEGLLCCTSQGCEPLSIDVAWACAEIEGYVVACDGGVTNADGTAECLEDES